MPFAKQWRAAMFPDFREQKAYVDYKGSKEILHRMKGTVENHSTPEELIAYLLDEKKRVYNWSVKKVAELTKLAKGVEYCSRRFDLKLSQEEREKANPSYLFEQQKQQQQQQQAGSTPTVSPQEPTGDQTTPPPASSVISESDNKKTKNKNDKNKNKNNNSTTTSTKGGDNKEEEEAAKVSSVKDSALNILSITTADSDQSAVLSQSNVSETSSTTRAVPGVPTLNYSDLANITNAALPAENVRVAADAILHELLRFHECRNLNTDTIEHVVRRQFRYTPLQPTGRWVGLLSSEYDFMSLPIDEIFYLLSVAYERVKQNLEGMSEKDKIPSGAVGSQTFDRRSVKYWVHRQDLPFVIARIIQHMPVSNIKDTYKEFKEAGKPYNLGQRISSVYVDNADFLFYHRRLERLEGCSLIRFRWYSDTLEPDINTVKSDSDVYVEMKVHHEAWSGQRSTKRRFAVKERDMDTYLRGDLSLEPAIEKLRKKNTSEKEIVKFRELAQDILAKIKSYDLQPVLRTQCCRAAFQRGADQSVRVSIDTDLRMSSEDFGLSGHWRSTGEALGTADFPYAVVEVKLQCAENERLAPWIEELLKCRHMESVPKFSKYGHGIAALFGHTDKIQRVPYWVHQVNADIRAAYKPEESNWDPTVGLAKTWYQRLADRIIFGTSLPHKPSSASAIGVFYDENGELIPTAQSTSSSSSTRASASALHHLTEGRNIRGVSRRYLNHPLSNEGARGGSWGSTRDSLHYYDIEDEKDKDDEAVMAAARRRTDSQFRQQQQQHPTGYLPKFLSNRNLGRLYAQMVNPNVNLFEVKTFDIERRHVAFADRIPQKNVESICFPGYKDSGKQLSAGIPWQTGKAVKVPQKFDPKTLLTSERYMMKYVQKATVLAAAGIAIINFGNGGNLPTSRRVTQSISVIFNPMFHVYIGVCLCVTSVLLSLYALVVFRARAVRIYARKKIRYDDTFGPVVLTFIIIFTFIAVATNMVVIRYGPMLSGLDDF